MILFSVLFLRGCMEIAEPYIRYERFTWKDCLVTISPSHSDYSVPTMYSYVPRKYDYVRDKMVSNSHPTVYTHPGQVLKMNSKYCVEESSR